MEFCHNGEQLRWGPNVFIGLHPELLANNLSDVRGYSLNLVVGPTCI